MIFTAETTPPRPTLDLAGIAEAVTELAERLDIDPEHIAKCYRRHDDAYKLAKELERSHYYDFEFSDVEELDGVSWLIDAKQREMEAVWVKAYNVQPPHPNGTKILQGVIDSVCDHSPATYRVKETGCVEAGRFLLIKFENAFPVTETAAAQA